MAERAAGTTHESDLRKVSEALLVLSGHLPLFSSDRQKVVRAEGHLSLRDQAFEALDRLADALDERHPERRTHA